MSFLPSWQPSPTIPVIDTFKKPEESKIIIIDKDNEDSSDENELIDSEDDVDYSYDIHVNPERDTIDNKNVSNVDGVGGVGDVGGVGGVDGDINNVDNIIKIEIKDKSIQGLIDLGLKYKLNKRKKPTEDNSKKKEENKVIGDPSFKTSNMSKTSKTSNTTNAPSRLLSGDPIIHIMNAIATKINDEIDKSKKLKQIKEDKKKEIKFYTYNNKKYNIDIEKIVNLITPLTKLQQTIGMTKVKEHIIDMILYYIQGFETQTSNMLHTTIEGPPGIGKTRLGRILAQIYSAMGLIPTSKFKRVRRTDLIGKYLGHTAHKTQEVIDEADGGVLFIDEAYSLGNGEKEDIYAKECIDTINMNLSEKKKNLIVIIAGYPNQLESSFFALNEGLQRRFPFRFIIDAYNEKEMKDIFYNQVRRLRWRLDTDLNDKYLEDFFKQNKNNFAHFGGDIETMLLNCKFTHAKRVLGLNYTHKKVINIQDLKEAYEKFINNKKKDNDMSMSTKMMYC